MDLEDFDEIIKLKKDELHALQNQTKYADVELNSDQAEQCIYTNDFIESQINGDDFDEWYSDVYPFCTGKSPRPFDKPSITDENDGVRIGAKTDELN